MSSFDPIREYFLRRLRQRVVESGGLVSSLDDWTVEVVLVDIFLLTANIVKNGNCR